MQNQVTYIRAIGDEEWKDLYAEYGIFLSDTAVSRLMTPAPNKEAIENNGSLMHGKRVIRDTDSVRKQDRNISLEIFIAGPKSTFLARYGSFCQDILDKGFFEISTSYLPNTVYRLTYLDCTQFSEFDMNIGKFVLNVNEPDPTNRGVTDSWENEYENL